MPAQMLAETGVVPVRRARPLHEVARSVHEPIVGIQNVLGSMRNVGSSQRDGNLHHAVPRAGLGWIEVTSVSFISCYVRAVRGSGLRMIGSVAGLAMLYLSVRHEGEATFAKTTEPA